jgi:hypothetical protein
MTVKLRDYKRGGFEVDIRFTWPDGSPYRDRRRSPVSGKVASLRWGQAREAELIRGGQTALEPPQPKKEVPTLTEFFPRCLRASAADGQKESGIDSKKAIFRRHIEPHLGHKRLNEITTEDIEGLKETYFRGTPTTAGMTARASSESLAKFAS